LLTAAVAAVTSVSAPFPSSVFSAALVVFLLLLVLVLVMRGASLVGVPDRLVAAATVAAAALRGVET
jgi:hypothetical protein